MSAVGIGAFGAHALADLLEQNQRVSVFELANRYQFYHGLALLFISLVFDRRNVKSRPVAQASVVALLLGTLIFCGSLYVLAVTNISWLGAVTPIGGVCLLVGWVCFLLSVRTFSS